MCFEKAAAQSDVALKAEWLEAAQHLLAESGESAMTLRLARDATPSAEATEDVEKMLVHVPRFA